MFKRPRLIAGAICATALISIAAAAGAAFASDDAPAGGHATTMHFLLRETQQVIDHAPAGPSNGDLVLVRGELLNPKTRKPVGTELGTYVMVDAANENRSLAQIVFTPDARSSLARLKSLMATAGLSPAGLGDIIGSRPAASMVLGGSRELSKAQIRKLAEHFKIDAGYFF